MYVLLLFLIAQVMLPVFYLDNGLGKMSIKLLASQYNYYYIEYRNSTIIVKLIKAFIRMTKPAQNMATHEIEHASVVGHG